MKTRIGKIARLPAAIREQLNLQLENGALGTDLLAWLNGLPEVQRIMAELFGGRPLTHQNLSVWRYGGYQDWLVSRDGRIQLREMMQEAQSLNESGSGKDGDGTGHLLATFMLVELAQAIDRLHHTKNPEERWELLRKLSVELSRLRTDDCREKRLRLRQLKAKPAQAIKSDSK
jgi:hypothetical protein